MSSDRNASSPSRSGSHGGGVLIALHGHGDHASTALEWGRRVAPADWDVVAPQAERDASGHHSWFSTTSRGVDSSELLASVNRIEEMIRSRATGAESVVVAGFSQGGALAMAMAWRGTAASRVIAMCSFFPECELPGAAAGESGDTPLLILGTSGDRDVPAFMGMDAAAMFESAGHRVRSATVNGDHRVDANLAAVAGSFVTEDHGRRRMFSLGIPVERVQFGSEFTSAQAIAEVSASYERLGFHAGYVTDHPAPDDRWLAGGGHHALEPTVALSAAAAATSTLKLHTNVYVLPYRNPFLAAKALSSLDALSQGRLIAGVAAGYVRPEFAALGTNFEDRGKLLEEALELLPRIWAGDSVEASGDGWSSRGATALPRTHGGPPLWVGGNSRAALRRAVTMAQGWSPMPTPPGSAKGLKTTEITDSEQLAGRLDEARRLCEEYRRVAPLTICFVPFGLADYLADPAGGVAPLVEEIGELFEMGVDWFPLMVPGQTREEVISNAGELAGALGL